MSRTLIEPRCWLINANYCALLNLYRCVRRKSMTAFRSFSKLLVKHQNRLQTNTSCSRRVMSACNWFLEKTLLPRVHIFFPMYQFGPHRPENLKVPSELGAATLCDALITQSTLAQSADCRQAPMFQQRQRHHVSIDIGIFFWTSEPPKKVYEGATSSKRG